MNRKEPSKTTTITEREEEPRPIAEKKNKLMSTIHYEAVCFQQQEAAASLFRTEEASSSIKCILANSCIG